jgi:hypothetical protein
VDHGGEGQSERGIDASAGEQILVGSNANTGLVVRVGDTVRRPWHPSTPATHALLTHLDQVLPGVAPVPVGLTGRDEQGREMLTWIDGDVALPPFPDWVSSTLFLTSLGHLLRRIHDALDGWTLPVEAAWSQEIPDPHGGPIIAHTDIWPGNVITRDGRVTAIIDWELAAHGRRIWDVVSTAKLCVPFTAPSRRDRAYDGQDVTDRLQDFLDAYQLNDTDRAIFTQVLDERRVATERFVRGRIAHREPHFVEKWDHPAGEELLLAETAWIKTVPADIARSQQTP